jgi:hypothetical protein
MGCQDLLRDSCVREIILRFIDGRKNERGTAKLGLKEITIKQ